MDRRLQKTATSRVVPQLDRGANAASKSRKQFRPRLDVADEAVSGQAAADSPPLSETKQEPVVGSSAEKKPRMTKMRGYDRVTSIFELGVGQNAPRSSGLRLSADDGGGSHSNRGRHGAAAAGGAQENFVDLSNSHESCDVSGLGSADLPDTRGALDPITPFHDDKIKSAEDIQKNCSSILFDKSAQSPILFQIPLGSLCDTASGVVKIGCIQRMKSGKLRLLLPTVSSTEQEVPNVMDSNIGSPAGSVNSILRPHAHSVALSFASSSQPTVSPHNQIVCVYPPQAVKAEPAVSSVTVTAAPNRPASIPNITSNMFVLGRVSARVSSSVNL